MTKDEFIEAERMLQKEWEEKQSNERKELYNDLFMPIGFIVMLVLGFILATLMFV